MKTLKIISSLCAIFALSANAMAATPKADSLLITDLGSGVLSEYKPNGTKLQSFAMPDFEGGFHDLRGVAMGQNGVVHMYNGTFNPHLTNFNIATGSVQSNLSAAGWSTVNNTRMGAIGAFHNTVFASDMQTAGAGAANGIVAFDLGTGLAQRFGQGHDYSELTVGRNGLLYAYDGKVDVYDPNNFSLLRSFNLGGASAVYGMAVDKKGNMFTISAGGMLSSYDANGQRRQALNMGNMTSLTDIAVSSDGRLAFTDSAGWVHQTNTEFSGMQRFQVGAGSYKTLHLDFVQTPVPEAETWAMLGAGLLGLSVFARRRRQQA